MNQKTYLGLILAACTDVVFEPLLVEALPVSEQTAKITAPAIMPTEHQQAFELYK